ncbi:Hpt domain-containing protein [Lacinutrix sp. MedPE-SW]|uniref:Hpt domain-containing protein n=1 Tax=Lacinutrix sp. MedPE-SW TaxID=1860087 RepID=UPI000910C8CC|nr:Hpt domain-containing protein [Lacinutrix sp. MedPE-SW]OIQ20368.1 MAG: histidine kinase [Lacinutrix sp. MedPE-SW]
MEQPNQTYINSLSGGDEIFKQKLIEVIKKEFPEEKQIYFENFNANNFALAANNVHKLKHKISILGLEKSYDIAVTYENNLLEGSTNKKEEFETILKTISNYLETL